MIITFEGIDGSGKSTQARRLESWLKENGHDVLYVREPGGTQVSERIRSLLLDPSVSMDGFTEMLLFSAARSELCRAKIRPHHEQGGIVICDRFYDSTVAYQGGGRQLADPDWLAAFQRRVADELVPDRTYLIRVDTHTASERLAARSSGASDDRMEQAGRAFFERVVDTYDRMAAQEPDRFLVVDGARDEGVIANDILEDIRRLLPT
ncbi:MAG: dTMP kinase [Bacteroidota bacterium]|nr:dTMP kinase [Bacteroidota bacterium]